MNKEPIWVLEKTVLHIHDAQLAEHGGSVGVRDTGLLQSDLAHPLNLFSYQKPDICELAVAYAERIAKNHPFIDGNKRTAYVVMQLFLNLNGFKFVAKKEERVTKFVQLASSEISAKDFATWLDNNIVATETISCDT
jgi:death-on-curing protein